jgi:hypothetical protein
LNPSEMRKCVLCAVCCVLCAVCCVLCAVCCVLCAVCCVLCVSVCGSLLGRTSTQTLHFSLSPWGQGGDLRKAVKVLPTTAAFGVDVAVRGFPFKLVGLGDRREYYLVAETEASRMVWIQALQLFSR